MEMDYVCHLSDWNSEWIIEMWSLSNWAWALGERNPKGPEMVRNEFGDVGLGGWGGQLRRTESPERWAATETKVGQSLAASRPREQLSHSIQHTYPCRVKGVRVNATQLYETWASGQVRTERVHCWKISRFFSRSCCVNPSTRIPAIGTVNGTVKKRDRGNELNKKK